MITGNYGEWIAKYRKLRRFKQTEVATFMGVSSAYINNVEKDPNTTAEVAKRICSAINKLEKQMLDPILEKQINEFLKK